MIIGTTFFTDFITTDPASGGVADADVLPTVEVFENANDTPILTPAATKRAGKIGDYRIQIDATIGNGFVVGRSYNVVVTATVAGVLGKGIITTFIVTDSPASQIWDALVVAYNAPGTMGHELIGKVDAGGNVSLAPAERDALALAILTLADGVETNFTLARTLRIVASAVAGKTTLAGVNRTFRNLGDTLDQIGGTTTPGGDRLPAGYGP